MPRVKQLTVSVENRPGTLAHVAKVLGEAKVNILGCLTATLDAQGAVRVELPNKPGALGQFAGKLASKEINIMLGYQTSAKASRRASVVLAVSDLEKAARVR